MKFRLALLLPGLVLVSCEAPPPEPSPEAVAATSTTEQLNALTGALECKLPVANVTTALPLQLERRFVGNPSLANSRVGQALAAGDLDGDGALELLVGAPGTGTLKGYAFAVRTTANGQPDIRTHYARYEGELAGNRLGAALAAGNFTAGTGNDLVMGAPGHSTPLANQGVVYPVDGAQITGGDRALTAASVRFRGAAASDGAGQSLAVGNVTGTNALDLIVGVPLNESTGSPNTGTVYVFPGAVTATAAGSLASSALKIFGTGTTQADVQAGASVTVADMDGDGQSDLVVGAPRLDVGANNDSGAAYVFYGPLTGSTKTLADADLVLTGVNAGELAGTAVTAVGDANNDGYEELLVGAPGSGALPGRAYLVYGGARQAPQTVVSLGAANHLKMTGILGDQAGVALASPGDINGDGFRDLLIGAPNHSSATGAVYVVYGNGTPTGFPTGSLSLATVSRYMGASGGNQAGSALVGLGDVNNDGAADFAVGAPGFNSNAGIVYLVFGVGPRPWYTDTDGDRYGLDSGSEIRCGEPTTGFALSGGDCNDALATINPGAEEICDGVDNNCDGLKDDDVGAGTTIPFDWYLDADGDKHVDFANSVRQCAAPGAEWTRTPDVVGEECATPGSDSDATVYLGAPEICDAQDNNCDGNVDDDATRWSTWYRDADSDTFGNAAQSQKACFSPDGFVANNQDCDDTDSLTRPTGTEVCDGKDNNCSGVVDEGVKTTYYQDADHDNHGTLLASTQACSQPPNHSLLSDDCDDTSALRYPGKAEVCDGLDNNCDFDTDEGVKTTFFRDADNDTFGTALTSTQACVRPAGYATSNTDCNDANSAVKPSATEVCDNVDNNCNGTVDEGVKLTFYADADGDGVGTTNPSFRIQACTATTGYVSTATDCNDNRGDVKPGAPELCDDFDNDCDSLVDEGLATSNWYLDADGDGYGGAGGTAVTKCRVPGPGYVGSHSDCDDTTPSISPAQTEICEPTSQTQVDNNCDGDTQNAANAVTWYRDADGDTYGTTANTQKRCTQPSGYVGRELDCDDANASRNPGRQELCEAGGASAQVDNDCDVDTNDVDPNVPEANGGTPIWYGDADRDGHSGTAFKLRWCTNPTDLKDPVTQAYIVQGAYLSTPPDDCNDSSSGVYMREAWYEDKDGDGCGNPLRSVQSCGSPSCGIAYVRNNTDLNDNLPGNCSVLGPDSMSRQSMPPPVFLEEQPAPALPPETVGSTFRMNTPLDANAQAQR
ncbi:hypothetical protein G4177_09655 [Corallococcus sp. ZKHCc1 1396]|uniref:VCBS repeat-containing protein n=1 Tax=Corallococcus soli TaxID=2710757 RepID=A0ABR9PKG1_9BACT|nr:MopE-related protein [Corallococcus soli]MBE4748428.1 hypothetical protein [Corallococcus soli]